MPSDSPERHDQKHAMMNGASSEVPRRRSRMSLDSASVYRRLERSRVLRVGMVYFTVAANGGGKRVDGQYDKARHSAVNLA